MENKILACLTNQSCSVLTELVAIFLFFPSVMMHNLARVLHATITLNKSTLFSDYLRKWWNLRRRIQCGRLKYLKRRHMISRITHIITYYMEESVWLGTKPLVVSIRHFIRDPSGVFSVCHLCECRIVQWRHDSRLLLLLNWFLHIIKRTLHVGSKIWILCSRGKNNNIVLATRT